MANLPNLLGIHNAVGLATVALMVEDIFELAFGHVEDVVLGQEKVLLSLFFYAAWTISVVALGLGTASP